MNIYIYLLFYLTLRTQCLPLESDDNVGFSTTNYTGYKVVTCLPATLTQVQGLKSVQEEMESVEECSLDWWSDPSHPNISVSVMVPPDCLSLISDGLERAGLVFSVSEEDLQEMIRKERAFRWETLMQRDWSQDNWNTDVYHNLDEIRERVDQLANTHSQFITKINLETTYEGRSIDVLKVRMPDSEVRPAIWLDCGIHAREWVSPPACLHAILKLVQDVNSVNPRDNLLAVYVS